MYSCTITRFCSYCILGLSPPVTKRKLASDPLNLTQKSTKTPQQNNLLILDPELESLNDPKQAPPLIIVHLMVPYKLT